jgi:uncharacterized membrane protein
VKYLDISHSLVPPLSKINFYALAPAWCYFGETNVVAGFTSASVVQLYFMFFFPFIASMAFSSCAFDDKKVGVNKFIIQRSGRKNYYISQALVTFSGAFLIVFASSLLGELTIMTAVPLNSIKINPYYPLEPDLPFRNVTFLQSLCYNYPYLYFFIYDIIGGIFGGLIGLLSYSISLHFKTNRFLVVTISGIAYLVMGLIFTTFGLHAMCPEYLVVPPTNIEGIKLEYVLVLGGALLMINFLAIWIKAHITKDEL